MDQGGGTHLKAGTAFNEPRDEGSYTLSHTYDRFLAKDYCADIKRILFIA